MDSTSHIQLLDTVALAHDLPESGLVAGEVGAVVEVYSDDAFEVEFCDESGRTYGLHALRMRQVIPLYGRDLPLKVSLKNRIGMGRRLPAEQAELLRRVEEVLHYLWDPIGVAGVPEARNEYEGYAPHVFSLLVHRASASDIIDFLVQVEVQSMGLTLTPQTRERAANITAILEKYRELLSRHSPGILR